MDPWSDVQVKPVVSVPLGPLHFSCYIEGLFHRAIKVIIEMVSFWDLKILY